MRKSQAYYAKVKRDKFDLCNICRKQASLSWDHVPPRGGIEVTPVEQETILQRLTGKENEKIVRISQNGVKFRTICDGCNNTLLGRKYDPVLNDFALGVGRFLNATLEITPIIKYETRPNLLIRAIVGHLLAAKGYFENTTIDEKLRNFILDESADFPDNLRIFYWVYPYPYVVVIRDVVMPAVRGNFGTKSCFSILKYFPIAYLVCDLAHYEGLDDLTFYYDENSSKLVNIPIKLRQVKHPEWPELVDDTNFMVGGQSFKSSLFATPRSILANKTNAADR
ncbi:MAG: hypothetical protein NTX17_07840 [Candidatus Eisenbacteria bacterium]|nr:hypothetical protein [Candidatus Eisenbacteria bacterium]